MKKRQLQAMETKKRLLSCAYELFREKGYNAVTVDDIINKANSSKGGFYTHFESKEALLFSMAPMADETYSTFLKMDIKAENTIHKISLFIDYVLKMIEEKIGLEFISAIYASQIKDLTTHRAFLSPDRTYYRLIERLIDEAKEKKEISLNMSSVHIATILTTCIRGVIYDWCLKKGEFNLVEYGREIIGMILNQIKYK